jgi:hypothetical protein
MVKALRDKASVKRWTWMASSPCASTLACSRLARAFSTDAITAMMPSGSRPTLRMIHILKPVESRSQREGFGTAASALATGASVTAS